MYARVSVSENKPKVTSAEIKNLNFVDKDDFSPIYELSLKIKFALPHVEGRYKDYDLELAEAIIDEMKYIMPEKVKPDDFSGSLEEQYKQYEDTVSEMNFIKILKQAIIKNSNRNKVKNESEMPEVG